MQLRATPSPRVDSVNTPSWSSIRTLHAADNGPPVHWNSDMKYIGQGEADSRSGLWTKLTLKANPPPRRLGTLNWRRAAFCEEYMVGRWTRSSARPHISCARDDIGSAWSNSLGKTFPFISQPSKNCERERNVCCNLIVQTYAQESARFNATYGTFLSLITIIA